MKLMEALNYVRRNHEALRLNGECVIGVAHTPDDADALFYIVELGFHPAQEAGENQLAADSYYKVLMEGGVPLQGEFIEVFNTNHSIHALARDLPVFAGAISYQTCKLKDYHFGGMIEDGLHSIFPNLPSLTGIERDNTDDAESAVLYYSESGDPVADFNFTDYNSYAVALINKANGQYAPPAPKAERELFYL